MTPQRARTLARRWLPHAAAAAATLALGIGIGGQLGRPGAKRPTFHDFQVNHPRDYSHLVTPAAPEVVRLARRLGSLEAAYHFVRDAIVFEPMRASGTPAEVLRAGRASCLGKATLLVSLYRALGVPASDVRVVIGQIATQEELIEHAWVDMEHESRCLQQDATDLLGVHEFGRFPGEQFVNEFVSRELFCFNDQGFAAVSQLNRLRRKP